MERKIMFLGPSGSGKTTLAKIISEEFGIPFISGSYSDMIPSTKSESHRDMIEKSVGTIYSQDHQLLSMRSKVFGSQTTSFISDRSYLDNMAYFILKLAKDVKECDTESFRDNVITLLNRDCTDLIFVPFTDKMIGKWNIEDNGKRITNIYFQWQVSQIMYGLIRYFGYKGNYWNKKSGEFRTGKIKPMELLSPNNPENKSIRVITLESPDIDIRLKHLRKFILDGE